MERQQMLQERGVLLGQKKPSLVLKLQNHLTSRKLEAQGSTLAYAGADSESRNPVPKSSLLLSVRLET